MPVWKGAAQISTVSSLAQNLQEKLPVKTTSVALSSITKRKEQAKQKLRETRENVAEKIRVKLPRIPRLSAANFSEIMGIRSIQNFVYQIGAYIFGWKAEDSNSGPLVENSDTVYSNFGTDYWQQEARGFWNVDYSVDGTWQ